MASELDRPTVLTPEAQRTIMELVAEGSFLSVACRAAGIDYSTLSYWRRLCESGAEHAQKYADFFAYLKRAPALAEASSVGRIRRGVPGWQGSAWFLERRYPRRWAAKKAPEPKPDGADTITVEYADRPIDPAAPEPGED